jgi:drug/metabolite transporter (DMT)-like permease
LEEHRQTNFTSKIYLHIAVILFGFTAILGNLIDLSALMIVWWRVAITCFSLFFLTHFGKDILKIPSKDIFRFLGIGFVIGIHWLCFYGSVKLSNSSVTLICIATTGFFTALLEPLLVKGKSYSLVDILLGIAIIPCMYLCVKGSNLTDYLGVYVGLTSALLASLFTILNKQYMGNTETMSMTMIELFGVWLTVSMILPFYIKMEVVQFLPKDGATWFYLLVLALLCTTVAWVLSLKALKYVSAFEANLIVNLEPVYGILLAAVLLKEFESLSISFYLGAVMIILIIIAYPGLRKKFL